MMYAIRHFLSIAAVLLTVSTSAAEPLEFQLTFDAKAKATYQYNAGESVVATCVATTFFSHDLTPPSTTGAKAGQPAAAGAR